MRLVKSSTRVSELTGQGKEYLVEYDSKGVVYVRAEFEDGVRVDQVIVETKGGTLGCDEKTPILKAA
jgi:hypothetical protein